MTADLFPETLLVRCEHDRVFTTSLKIAEHFGKRHDNVMRAIRAICDATPEAVWRLNFEERDSLDERGKTQPFYELTHDGFAIAVMGFTGPAALAWKWQFLAAFRALEAELRAVRERDAAWYRNHAATLRAGWYARYPLWLDLRTAATLGETRAQMARDLGRHPSTISRNLRRMRQVGLLTTPETPRRRVAGPVRG